MTREELLHNESDADRAETWLTSKLHLDLGSIKLPASETQLVVQLTFALKPLSYYCLAYTANT